MFINRCIYSQKKKKCLGLYQKEMIGLEKKSETLSLEEEVERNEDPRIEYRCRGSVWGRPENLTKLFAAARVVSYWLTVDVTVSVPTGCMSEPLEVEGSWVCLRALSASLSPLGHFLTLSWFLTFLAKSQPEPKLRLLARNSDVSPGCSGVPPKVYLYTWEA